MDRILAEALNNAGYDELYERYIPDLGPSNPSGERRAISPFPGSSESTPSFFVNTHTGMWTDYHAESFIGISGGNYVQFVAWMNSQQVGSEWIADYDDAERQIKFEVGIVAPISPATVAEYQAVMRNPQCPGNHIWRGIKPWNHNTLRTLGIGYDAVSRRMTIPFYDAHNNLVNCKLYQPGATGDVRKNYWAVVGIGGNYLFPPAARLEPSVILVEGEADVITLRGLGFNACSGTGGAGDPLPTGPWYYDKVVYVWMDNDVHGINAANNVCQAVVDNASETRLIEPIVFPGWRSGADASDYVKYLFDNDYTPQQIQALITTHLANGRVIERARNNYDMPAVDVEFSQILSSRNDGRRMRFPAHIMGKTGSKYSSPSRVRIACPTRGHRGCSECPMNERYHGRAEIELDTRSPETLKYIQTTEFKMHEAILKQAEIPNNCPSARIVIMEAVDVEHIVTTSVAIGKENDLEGSIKAEIMVISDPERPIKANEDYTIEGFVYPSPNTRAQIIVADTYEMKDSILENPDFTPAERAQMEIFHSPRSVFEQMEHIAEDFQDSTTRIYGRIPLHMLYRTVWHSIIEFPFMGDMMRRGWIEAIVVGDTRCIEGDAKLHINRGGNGRQYTLRETYQKFHGINKRNWDKNIPTYCRALVNGELHQHLVKDVVYSGIKDVSRITLSSGKSLRMTTDHELLTPSGAWVKLMDLKPGDNIMSNGSLSRPGPQNGNWKGGRSVRDDGYILISEQQGHHRANRHGQVLEHILVMEQELNRRIEKEEVIHHIDEDRSNNNFDNLRLFKNQAEHAKFHAVKSGKTHLHFKNAPNACFLPVVDTIVSIVPAGKTDVYDVVMDDPHRNFVANNIIVHNCGKSHVFKRLAEIYEQGILVDCKMQSAPGIIGAVENSAVTGERFVVAGLYPRQDKRGPICMDEFQGSKSGEIGIMDYMSSMRAEGKVVITKAGKASFWARVRAIWLANPGRGRLIADIGGCACEIINTLIAQPEDVARFDIGACVSQGEVPVELINSVSSPTTPIYSAEAHRLLLRWAWSRKPEQIKWESGAEAKVIDISNAMIEKYDSELALVEPADQRKRVAKVAVSIAAQSYSTVDGHDLIVKIAHVEAAQELFYLLYDNPVFGYDRFSQRIKGQRVIFKRDTLLEYLDVMFKANPVRLATMMLGMTEFDTATLNTLIPMPVTESKACIHKLLEHRAIIPLNGPRNRGFFRITDGFVSVLRKFIENQEVINEKQD